MATTFSVNRRGIEQIYRGRGPGAHVPNYARELARDLERHAKRLAPVKTGRLRASIDATPLFFGPRVIRFECGTRGVPYAIYQELGTGIYEGRGLIRPRDGRALVLNGLRGRGGDGTVFRAYTRGVPGLNYMANALLALEAQHPELRVRILRR